MASHDHNCDPCNVPCDIPDHHDPCDQLWPILEMVRDCLCDQLDRSLGGPVCRCAIVQGSTTILDECCAGFAWVRVVESYPSVNFPARKTGAEFCETFTMAARLQLGVARCQPTFDDQTGEPPSVAALEEAARIGQADRAAMHRAIRCCVGPELGLCKKLEIGPWEPLPEAGMCGGGTVSLIVPYTDYGCAGTTFGCACEDLEVDG